MNSFIPSYLNKIKRDETNIWLIFNKREILITIIDNKLPEEHLLDDSILNIDNKLYLGTYNDRGLIAVDAENNDITMKNANYINVLETYTLLGDELFSIILYGLHLIKWHIASFYCGKCGARTIESNKERAKLCPACDNLIYPAISPAIIVAITKGDSILLGRSDGFPKKFFSVLAGYVEPGETLEECVAREVMEETGITVKNISYFDSQPWGLSGSLMIGFTAEYESGIINVNKDELAEADWFTKDNLPEIPSKASISGKLIQWFVDSSVPQI